MKFHQITMNFIPCFVFNNIERKVDVYKRQLEDIANYRKAATPDLLKQIGQ